VTLVLCYTGCLANCKLPEWNSTYSNTIDNHFTSIRWDRKWWMKWEKVLWQACQQDKEMCSILSNTESGNFGYWRCLGEEWNTTKVILSWFGEAWDRVSVNRGHCPMTVGWRRWWITESLDCLGMEYSWPWCAFEHSRYGMTMWGLKTVVCTREESTGPSVKREMGSQRERHLVGDGQCGMLWEG
jgi:hypothetical protein